MTTWIFDKERLIGLREMRGMTQEMFGKELGVTKQLISMWESEGTLPNVRTIIKICNVFNVDPRYFFTQNVRGGG